MECCTSYSSDSQQSLQSLSLSCSRPSFSILSNLPVEVLENVLAFVSLPDLLSLNSCCKRFHAKDFKGTSLIDKAARDLLHRMHGPEQACRWRFCSWLERLKIAETESQFDRLRCEKQGFMLLNDPVTLRVSMIRLEGIGPKLLVSDLSTADVSLLRWRMEIRGNNAVEFGTIPVSLQDNPKSLHKCLADTCGERPSGFYSSITIGSLLPVRLPVMKGSIIEMVARRDRLDVIVTHPLDAAELSWKNTVTVPTAYKGPRELRFQQDLAPDCPVKLAVTCWARSCFAVLQSACNNSRSHSTPE